MPMNPKLLRPRAASAAAFSPTDISGLYAWYDADDAATFTTGFQSPHVSEWQDKSGNSRHLSQSNGADQPKRMTNQLNGRACVVYDQSNQYLAAGTAGDWTFLHHGTDYYSLFCVMKPTVANGASGTWASTSNIYLGYQGFMGFLYRDDATDTLIDANYGDENSNAVNTALVLAAGTDINLARAIVTSGRPSSNALRLRDNFGTADDGPTGTITTSSSAPPYGLAIGADGQDVDGSLYPYGLYVGLFAEIIVYRGATDLSDTQRNQVIAYLRTRWGLA